MAGDAILILDGHTNAAAAVLQSLGRAGYDCCLAAAELGHSGFASRYLGSKAVYPDPLLDKGAFQRWLVAFQGERRFALIIPSTECTLIPVHEVRDHPALKGVLALPPPAALELAIDKERVLELAGQLGVPTPPSVPVRRPDDADDPRIDLWLQKSAAVVKTVRSKVWIGQVVSEHGVRMCRTRAELDNGVALMLPDVALQIQQWVPGRGIGIEVLVDRGEIVMSFAHERIHEVPLTGGGSSYRRSIEAPPQLLADSAKLLRALGWHGVAMIEFRIDKATERYWLMEINGRFWGSLPLALFAGADFPLALVQLLLQGHAPVQPPPRRGVYARKFTRDLDWTKEILKRKLRRGHEDGHLVLEQPLGRSLFEWTRLFTGQETLDGAELTNPGPILHEVSHYLSRELVALTQRARRVMRLQSARRTVEKRLRKLGGARRVLVLCAGNICRSAYAGLRLRELARALGPEARLEVRTGGFYAQNGRSSPPRFQRVALGRGADLSQHRSQQVTRDDLEWAELILLMDDKNHRALTALDRRSLGKSIWLGALDGDPLVELADPIDAPPESTELLLDRIDACLERLLVALAPSPGKGRSLDDR